MAAPQRADGPRLGRADFEVDAETLARGLLGCALVRVLEGGVRLAGRIVETEAYAGVDDRASHAYGGRRTPRNESMYGAPGTAYVYLIYGLHHCFNVVCGPPGTPWAVLVRALAPREGLDGMRARRAASPAARPPPDGALCSGPGRLCRALAIDRTFDGADLVHGPSLFLCAPPSRPPGARPPGDVVDEHVTRGPRVGVDYAGEWAQAPLRFRADSPTAPPRRRR
ncbi:MAG TPA: DNA-3-methyladenine glycosylase [Polyangiaceae bacterium]|nr:DNA-3-methyladenine glycosylase [Polyangiaceae bacterium]